MENYSAKATAPKPDEKTVPEQKVRKKVVTGNTTVKKEGAFEKFAHSFVQEDAKTIGGFVWSDVIVPAIKTTIADVVKNTLDMLFWGKSGTGRTTNVPAGRFSYNSIYKTQQANQARTVTRQQNKNYYYDDISFETRDDALKVLNSMKEELNLYPEVSVAAFFDYAGRSREGIYADTDNKWGWTDLSAAKVYPSGGKWWIEFPKAIPLE